MTLSKKQSEQRNAILESLYLYGNMSRAELSRLLDITPATMTALTSYLLQKDLIRELGEELNDAKIGRKKILLDIKGKCAYYIGLELTDSKLFLCLTDNLGQCFAQETVVIDRLDLETEVLEQRLVTAINKFLDAHSEYAVEAIGIAVPGHYDQENQKIVSNNPFWSQFDLRRVAQSFKIPIYAKNNVKCMALRELYLGSDKKTNNFVFMNLKRGIFASYVYKGQIYGDENHLVGEVGHVVVNPHGEQCEWCGQAGCLQTYASITWLVKKARYAFAAKTTPYLNLLVKEPEEIKLSHVITAYKMGDEVIQQMMEQALNYLAVQLHNVQMMLDIDTIYVHGQLFQEQEIADKLKAKLDRSTTIVQPNRTMTRHIKPYDPMMGALGASALAIQSHFIQQEF